MAQGGQIFSLEEDECNDLFITQDPKGFVNAGINLPSSNGDSNDGMLLGLSVNDFQSPCSSLINRKESGIYSDISSDDGDFQCSQVVQNER